MAQARAPDGMTRFDDRRERSDGIETLANAARGSLFNVAVAADGAFARIESELLGYYLLGDRIGCRPTPTASRIRFAWM